MNLGTSNILKFPESYEAPSCILEGMFQVKELHHSVQPYGCLLGLFFLPSEDHLVVYLLLCCCEHHDQKQLGNERVCISSQAHDHEGKSGKEVKAGTRKQELKQRPWEEAASWLAFHGSLSLISCSPQDPLPRSDIIHSELSPPKAIIDKKIPHRLFHGDIVSI